MFFKTIFIAIISWGKLVSYHKKVTIKIPGSGFNEEIKHIKYAINTKVRMKGSCNTGAIKKKVKGIKNRRDKTCQESLILNFIASCSTKIALHAYGDREERDSTGN